MTSRKGEVLPSAPEKEVLPSAGLRIQGVTANNANTTNGIVRLNKLLSNSRKNKTDILVLGCQEMQLIGIDEIKAMCETFHWEVKYPKTVLRTNTKPKERGFLSSIGSAVGLSDEHDEAIQSYVIYNPERVKSVDFIGVDSHEQRTIDTGKDALNKGAVLTRCRATKIDGTESHFNIVNEHGSSDNLENRNADWLLGVNLQNPVRKEKPKRASKEVTASLADKAAEFDALDIPDVSITTYDANIRFRLDPFVLESRDVQAGAGAFDKPGDDDNKAHYRLVNGKSLYYYNKKISPSWVPVETIKGHNLAKTFPPAGESEENNCKNLAEVIKATTEHIPTGFDPMEVEGDPTVIANQIRPQGTRTVATDTSYNKEMDRKQLAKRVAEGVLPKGRLDGINVAVYGSGKLSSQEVQAPALILGPELEKHDHCMIATQPVDVPTTNPEAAPAEKDSYAFIKKRTAIADQLAKAAPALAQDLMELTESVESKAVLADIYYAYVAPNGLVNQHIHDTIGRLEGTMQQVSDRVVAEASIATLKLHNIEDALQITQTLSQTVQPDSSPKPADSRRMAVDLTAAAKIELAAAKSSESPKAAVIGRRAVRFTSSADVTQAEMKLTVQELKRRATESAIASPAPDTGPKPS